MISHDPGGKVRFALPLNVAGDAAFSPCGRYRHVLYRTWGPGAERALWIGMNPSTADGSVDDPTCRREVIYTRDRLGLGGYTKCNVMDYRSTSPKGLLASGVVPQSDKNLPAILAHAQRAARVIAAWGALPKVLRPYAERVERELCAAGIELWCLGFTKDGSPRHPLYVRSDTELAPYPRGAR